MFVILLTALVVAGLFIFDNLIDGDKLFHIENVEQERNICPFTTVEAFVLSK
ncbi:hypothetical protein [Dethiobacter alkaliphilus]|uniref:Uncharacterized protein n=1 Tax=Dethiobacter alkaliphilus AHT 1 TaxID=555088 RepID=C0GHN3_DETAL|nr:hypothetical protein [Dethiobacter alkaliphilus]EEG77239.1 hypothetical protein DealDRAFT_1992 [Dethiobacter alkaliphilus AHT 1]MCW3489959.1 hypothetical protein [Dethiobacter alkaliphilus]